MPVCVGGGGALIMCLCLCVACRCTSATATFGGRGVPLRIRPRHAVCAGLCASGCVWVSACVRMCVFACVRVCVHVCMRALVFGAPTSAGRGRGRVPGPAAGGVLRTVRLPGPALPGVHPRVFPGVPPARRVSANRPHVGQPARTRSQSAVACVALRISCSLFNAIVICASSPLPYEPYSRAVRARFCARVVLRYPLRRFLWGCTLTLLRARCMSVPPPFIPAWMPSASYCTGAAASARCWPAPTSPTCCP